MEYRDIIHKKAPLPFIGQKRNMLRHIFEVARNLNRATPIYDVFGGSGLISNLFSEMGFKEVYYNDYDGYSNRLTKIEQTNAILDECRNYLNRAGVKADAKLTDEQRDEVMSILYKYDIIDEIDVISLSSRLLFSMRTCTDLNCLAKTTMYSNIGLSNFNAERYLAKKKGGGVL